MKQMKTTLTPKLCECGCGQVTAIARDTNPRWGHVRGRPFRFVRGHNFHTKESRTALAVRNKGNTHALGRKRPIEERMKISLANSGHNHYGWKGDSVGYKALHLWVGRHRVKTGVCRGCARKVRTEWANISGVYLRDLSDFAELCVPCHRELDSYEMG